MKRTRYLVLLSPLILLLIAAVDGLIPILMDARSSDLIEEPRPHRRTDGREWRSTGRRGGCGSRQVGAQIRDDLMSTGNDATERIACDPCNPNREDMPQGVKGTVISSRGGPLADAEVYLMKDSGSPVAKARIKVLIPSISAAPFVLPGNEDGITVTANDLGYYKFDPVLPLDIKLAKGSPITGRVTGPDKKGKTARSFRLKVKRWFGNASGGSYGRGTTAFEVRDPEGQKTVLAKIVIKQGCRVEGSVTRSGTPVANAKVSLTMQTHEGATPTHYVFDTVYTDTKGNFKSSRQLPAGTDEINAVQSPGFAGISEAQRSIQTIPLHPGPKPRIVHLRLPVD